MTEGAYISVAEAAERAGVHRATIIRYIRKGSLPFFRRGVSQAYLLRPADVDRVFAPKPGNAD